MQPKWRQRGRMLMELNFHVITINGAKRMVNRQMEAWQSAWKYFIDCYLSITERESLASSILRFWSTLEHVLVRTSNTVEFIVTRCSSDSKKRQTSRYIIRRFSRRSESRSAPLSAVKQMKSSYHVTRWSWAIGRIGSHWYSWPLFSQKRSTAVPEDESHLFFTTDRWLLRMSMCQSTRDDAAPSFIELNVVNRIGCRSMKREKDVKVVWWLAMASWRWWDEKLLACSSGVFERRERKNEFGDLRPRPG